MLAAFPVNASASHLCTSPTPHPCSHEPPTASFTWSPEAPRLRQDVEFTGTANANPDRRVESTTWDLDDDGAFDDANGTRATRAFERSGTYRVRFRVQDDEGDVVVATREVNVPQPPFPADLSGRPPSSHAYQANALRDGFIDAPAPAPPLAKRWARELGKRVSYPVVAEGRVYVTAGSDDTRGSTLFALDPRTGAILWARPIGETSGHGRSHVVYDGGRLFAEAGDGSLLALDPATGAPLWSSQFLTIGGNRMPLAEGGRVWTTTGGIGGNLLTLLADGRFEWYTNRIDSPSSPAADGANVYTAHVCDGVTAFTRDGTFQFQSGGLCGSSGERGLTPVVHGGRTYARQGRDYEETRGWIVRNDDGTVEGEFLADETPAFKGDVGLFVHNGVLTARNIASKADMWSFSGGKVVTAPLIVGDTAYVGSASGRVHALALGTGQEIWSDAAGKEILPPGEGYSMVTGLGAGEGLLLVPAGGALVAYGAPGAAPPARADTLARVRDLPPPQPGGGATVTHQVNARHDGFLNVSSPAPPLRRRWSRPVGEQPGYPIVAEGKAFGYGRRDHVVRAFDLATGKEVWAREGVDEGIYSNIQGAAYDDGKLFVNSGGQLIAFRAADGAELWRTRFQGEESAGGPPVATGGLIYTSSDNSVSAYRQSDGSRAWRGGTIGGHDSSPALDERRAYVSYACLNASAHDRGTGERAWSIHPLPCSGGGGASPALHNGLLYAREDDALVVLDPATGILLDSFSTQRSPAFAGSAGIFLNGKVLQAVDLATGALAWGVIGGDADLQTSPLIVGRHVYVGDARGSLFAVRLETGVPEWYNDAGASFPPSPTYENVRHHGLGAGGGYVVAATSQGLVAYGPHGGLAIDAKAVAKRLGKAKRAKLLRKNGFAVSVEAPGAGKLEVAIQSGRTVLSRGVVKTVIGGTARVALSPTKAGRRVLSRGRRVAAAVRIRFVPRKGKARSASRKVTLPR